jgi:hypothetical protein
LAAIEIEMHGAPFGSIPGHDPHNGRFTGGNSRRAAKKQRIAERLAKLRLDLDPSPLQEMLLPIIAGHLDDAERCQSALARTRATNAARRLLRDIPRKTLPVQLPSARELLDRLRP